MAVYLPNPSQRKVLECRNLACVIAGAGSGKTGTLVETLIRRLEEAFTSELVEKLEIENILALTFTEKAAAELRLRLARAFRERQAQAAEEDQAAFWQRQASKLDRAEIGTIHSYALKLVRENALLLGLSASISIEGDERSLVKDLRHIQIDWLDEADQDYLGLLEHYSPQNLHEILLNCAKRLNGWGMTGNFQALLEKREIDWAASLLGFKSQVTEALAFALGGGLNKEKAYFQTVRKALESLQEALRPDAGELLNDIESNLNKWEILLEASGNWYAKPGQELKKRLRESLKAMSSALTHNRAVLLKEKLLKLTGRLQTALEKRKKKRGVISFDDILILARRLLATRPEVRQEEILRRRLIYIDEFQDTNRLQADLMAYLLLRPEDDRVFEEGYELWQSMDWDQTAPRFSVFGDLKQSIYRFRGAEVEIMAGLKGRFSAGSGQVLALDHNYRSQKPLIDFFNTLFPSHPGLDFFSDDDLQKDVRPPLYPAPQVSQIRSGEEPPSSAGERAALQARLTAKYLNDLFSGKAGVLVPDGDGSARAPQPGEVAILFRRSKWMGLFQKEFLAAGWECRLAAGLNPFGYPEVRGLLAAYLYLSGIDEEESLTAALRSPLGPVSDAALLRLVWPGEPGESAYPLPLSSYFGRKTDPPPWPRTLADDDLQTLEELRSLIQRLKNLAGRLAPVDILEMLVEERHLLTMAGAEIDAEDRIRAITYFLARSRSVGGDRSHQPLSPAEELREIWQSWDDRRDGDESGHLKTEAVSLMTVHASKGLEFPVVIVAEADSRPSNKYPAVIISPAGQLALKTGSEAPEDYLQILADMRQADEAENARLLYVAATRARDHLAFLGWESIEKSGDETAAGHSWLDSLRGSEAASALCDIVDYSEDELDVFVKKADESKSAAPVAGRYNDHKMRLCSYTLPVTAFGRLLADPQAFYNEFHLGMDRDFNYNPKAFFEPGRSFNSEGTSIFKNLSASEAGTLFHAVLEHIDPREPKVEELLKSQALKLNLKPDSGESRTLRLKAEEFLASALGEAWRKSKAAGRPDFREMPFLLEVPDIEDGFSIKLSGVIDLFFIDVQGAGQIVDYKLAEIHQGTELESYENQLRIYAQALSGRWELPSYAASLYFAGADKALIHRVSINQAFPMKPLMEKLGACREVLKATRPLRPTHPGLWPGTFNLQA